MFEPSLKSILVRTVRRLAAVESAAGAVWGLVAAALALLFAAWLDLLWELPPSGRMAAWCAAGALGTLVLASRVWLLIRSARLPAVARRLDRAATSAGVIISGWELSAKSAASTARLPAGGRPSLSTATSVAPDSATQTLADRVLITAGLARLAVEHAARLAGSVPGSVAVSLRPLGRAGTACGVTALVLASAMLLLPALSRTQWLRFRHPWADVPPYSRINFRVTPGDVRVVYAAPLNVQVTVAGGSPERIELVYLTARHEEVLPMFPASGGAYRAVLARIEEPASYFIRAERARTRQFRIDVLTVPRIESVQFRIRPPAYTNDATYQGPLPQNGIMALPGTCVEVQATSNRPLSGGEIVLAAAAESRNVPLRPAEKPNSTVRGTFDVTATGRFELHLVDVDGQRSHEAFAGTITLLDDQRPLVRLLEPPAVSLATPSAMLPVTVSAEDDYGVQRVELYRCLNNSRPLPVNLPAGSPPPRRFQERTYLALNEYGLTPGDEIKMFARVEDNDPAGTKGSESSVVTVRIISQEDFDRLQRVRQGVQILLSKYQQVQRRLEKLAEEIDALQTKLDAAPAESALSSEMQEELKRLAEAMLQQQKTLEELAQSTLPFDADRNLSRQLQPLAEMLEGAARTVGQVAAAKGATCAAASEQLRDLAQRLRGDRDQYQQQVMEPLEHLRLVYPLMEDQSRFVVLAQRQRDLAERMAALKGRGQEDDPALRVRMRDLEDQQRKTREALLDLLDDIEEHAAALPEQEEYRQLRSTAAAFAAAVRDSAAATLMSGAENALAEFSGTAAYEQAVQAADVLEGFISKCAGIEGEGQGCLAFQPAWSESLGNTVAQLLAEAGLGMGGATGLGTGGGGGYSAMRSTLNNVGLYGALPASGPAGGEGRPEQSVAGGGSPGLLATGSGDAYPRDLLTEQGSASGASQGSVPPRYRQRVGQYFQRIAEETRE